jgi:hypothetical protein
VVVIASRIPEGICDVHGSYEQEGKTIGPYAWYSYPIVNWFISWAAMQVSRRLEDKGYRALPFPPTGFAYHHAKSEYPDFMHKHAAVAAGLGELGLNRLFLTPQFGAHQRLVSIITDAPLEADPMYSGPKLCDPKACNETCIKICPMKAFTDKVISVRIGDNVYEYRDLDSDLCKWHAVAGKYLRGIDGMPRYPDRKELDEILKDTGGMNKVKEKMNPIDKGFSQFTHTPTCGACMVKCRAPWK